MPLDLSLLENLGMEEILLWILTFAIVFGVLRKIDFFAKRKEIDAVVAISVAFLVLLATPMSMINIIQKMGTSLILVLIALIVMVAFLEIANIQMKKGVIRKATKEGGVTEEPIFGKVWEAHPYAFALILIILAILIFVGSGGLQALGIAPSNLNMGNESVMTIGFFIVIILAVFWMIGEKGKGE